MCRSVYLARSARHADDLGPLLRPAPPARGRTAPGFVRCPSAAIEAIIAEVVSRGFVLQRGAHRSRLLAASRRRPALRAPAATRRQSTRMKWFFSRASRKGTPLPIFVSKRMTRGRGCARLRASSNAASTAGRSLPSTRCTCQPNAAHLSASGSKASTLRRRTVGLLVVDVDEGDQVVELEVAAPTSPLPRSSPRRVRRRTCSCRRRPGCPSASARAPCRRAIGRPWPSEPPEISMPGV